MTGKPPGLVLFPNIDKTSYYIILSKNTLKTIYSGDLLKQKQEYTKIYMLKQKQGYTKIYMLKQKQEYTKIYMLKQKQGYTKKFVKAKTILIRVYKNICGQPFFKIMHGILAPGH